ncbi:MAG: 50S ribosomal protein L11 methyltransferase, partial [Fimbriimonadaceae bacterium]|nr:50S ribosomal protein L11 methyltransferase [Fimbriimonadaceae bacterium]
TDWEPWIRLFEAHGLPGTLQEDHPPAISAYIPPGEEVRIPEIGKELESQGAQVQIETVKEEDWAESWKQFFVPRRFGKGWLIQPTWDQVEPGPDERVITLDPGQAFGTGDHPTTRGCLILMEDCDLSGATVADIGCGSGILTVGAGRLGAERIVGVDVDSVAVQAARENLDRNGVTAEVFVGLGFDPLPEEAFDLVVSNIISSALIVLAPEAAARTKPGGAWIVSGIIQANWPDVQHAAESVGFRLDREIREDEWVSARFLR